MVCNLDLGLRVSGGQCILHTIVKPHMHVGCASDGEVKTGEYGLRPLSYKWKVQGEGRSGSFRNSAFDIVSQ